MQHQCRSFSPAVSSSLGEGGAWSFLGWGDLLDLGWKWGWWDLRHSNCGFGSLAPTRGIRSFWGSTQLMALGVLNAVCGAGGGALVLGSWWPRITALCYPTGFYIQLQCFKNCLIFLLVPSVRQSTVTALAVLPCILCQGFLPGKVTSLVPAFAHGRSSW